MTTPLNKLAKKLRDDFWDKPYASNRQGYLHAANELEAALTAHNQRWLDLADDLERGYYTDGLTASVHIAPYTGKDAAQRIRQILKEQK